MDRNYTHIYNDVIHNHRLHFKTTMKKAILMTLAVFCTFGAVYAVCELAWAADCTDMGNCGYAETSEYTINGTQTQLKTAKLYCFGYAGENSCEFARVLGDFPGPIIIQSFSVFWGLNATSSRTAYFYCPEYSTFYHQFDEEPPTGTYSLSNVNLYCGSSFQMYAPTGNFQVWMTYYMATSTINTMGINNTHFVMIMGFFIFMTGFGCIIYLFKRHL